jgi:hypothetical protein
MTKRYIVRVFRLLLKYVNTNVGFTVTVEHVSVGFGINQVSLFFHNTVVIIRMYTINLTNVSLITTLSIWSTLIDYMLF